MGVISDKEPHGDEEVNNWLNVTDTQTKKIIFLKYFTGKNQEII